MLHSTVSHWSLIENLAGCYLHLMFGNMTEYDASIALQQRHVSKIGLLFVGSDFDPFLKIPVTMACFHCIGTIPVV